jgi:lycopene cyclase domain-containing protein
LKYAYLLLNFLTVIFPVLLSFDKRVNFYQSWKWIWPGMAITGLLFLVWDVLFTIHGVWSFNGQYITGVTFFHLPFEEILFFLTVPFACIFIYACLTYYGKWQFSERITKAISIALICLAICLLCCYYTKFYTVITFGLLLLLLLMLQFIFKAQWLSRFYIAFMVSLLPFYIVNGLLTSIPIVMYNDAQNMHFRVGTIPFEDHFYSMCLLLMNVAFFEYFKSRNVTHDDGTAGIH